MHIRLLVTIAIFLLGYYLGRHMERANPVREHLRRLENGNADNQDGPRREEAHRSRETSTSETEGRP